MSGVIDRFLLTVVVESQDVREANHSPRVIARHLVITNNPSENDQLVRSTECFYIHRKV